MDWSECDLVEVVPGKVSGKPIVRGTRIPADVIVSNHEAGLTMEEIQEDFPGLTPWKTYTPCLSTLLRIRDSSLREDSAG